METYNPVVLIIYKIQVNNLVYIGSTFNFDGRSYKHKHRTHYKGHAYNLKLYKAIRDYCGDWDDKLLSIIDIYNLPERNKQFKLQTEQYYINLYDSFKNGLNMCNAILDVENKIKKQKISKKKYYIDNKDFIKNRSKLNYEKNRTKILSKVNCECGSSICLNGRLKHEKTIKHQKYLLSLK